MKNYIALIVTLIFGVTGYAQNSFPASGKVGIGTNNLHELFSIGDKFAYHDGGWKGLVFNAYWDSPNSYWRSSTWGPAGIIMWDTGNGAFRFYASGAAAADEPTWPQERFVILNNGNIGIGTSAPGARLHISDTPYVPNAGPTLKLSNAHGEAFVINAYSNCTTGDFAGSSTGGSIQILMAPVADNPAYAGVLGTINNSPLSFITNSTKRLLITGEGNVGIGTSNPTGKFTVAGSGGDSRSVTIDASEIKFRGEGIAHMSLIGPTDGKPYFSIGQTSSAHTPGALSTEAFVVTSYSNVGIGTTSPTEKLSVNGKIRAKEVIVDTGWSDYVFAKDYKLAPLSEVEQHIEQQGHLPGVPSAKDVAANGVSVGDMQAILLAKIEELTLHQIAQEKNQSAQKEELAALRGKIAVLEAENAILKTQTK